MKRRFKERDIEGVDSISAEFTGKETSNSLYAKTFALWIYTELS